jgi:hypothetical protein
VIETGTTASASRLQAPAFRTAREAVEQLREVAAAGRLASVDAETPDVITSLRRAAYELAWPLVWSAHTRPLENRKGHHACARSVSALADACLDGFHDDVEAVVRYLFAYGKQRIGNLEGWLTSRITAATVDGNRRRRGALGAQQRPRVPGWLATALRHDPWLVTLARLVIEWVGVRATAGRHLWPVDTWGEIRQRLAPGRGHPHPADVERDVDHVLEVMRTARPQWYATYIETPLGRKQAPVAARHPDDAPVSPLVLTDDHERDDAALSVIADAAVRAVQLGLAAGGEPRTVVRRVLSTLFLGPARSSPGIADLPLVRPPLDEHVRAVLAGDVDDLVEIVLGVVADCGPVGPAPVVGVQR